jgi:hypothetical protein
MGRKPASPGLTHDAAGLRHARPAFLAAAIVAQALSLGCYAQLYRQVLTALGARVRFRLAADVILATFFVSHLTPFGSARDGAAWLTAFRTLIFCRTRCVPGVGETFCGPRAGPPIPR